jgi:hypothetical protein
MPGLSGMPRCACGINVEAFQYAELPHVLHVFFFRVLKTFHDHRPTSAAGKEASDHTDLRGHRVFL